ncbi:Signal recognition particle 54 kDa protein, chloroplastic [Hordeum vulgare]|nr:Signal recognition particle 54 kDa protein, chloroplastic [Hordeum vulgare]
MREGLLHIRDVEGPKKTRSMEARLEAMEQQVFKCQGMVEHGLNANHMMITEFTSKHKIYDLQNQNCSIDLDRLKYGIITLIPTVTRNSDIPQFNPIKVINVIFCILGKGYANRVVPLADRIVHPDQLAFIRGRYILDGVLVFHKVLHEVHVKHLKVVLQKIDFHKSHDMVSLSFLREVLLRKGFDDHWVA